MIRDPESDAIQLYVAFWNAAGWKTVGGKRALEWSALSSEVKKRWIAVAERARNL